jgi:hypothetical protein
MKKCVLFLAAILVLTMSSAVFAQSSSGGKRKMAGKYGIGYNSQFGDALSVKYFLSDKMGVQALFGFNTDNYDNGADAPADVKYTRTTITFGGKLLYNLVLEKNLMAYTGGGVGINQYSTDEDGADPRTSFALVGLFGAEYFIPWFPNLGLGLEIGLGITSYSEGDASGSNIYLPYNNSANKSILNTGLLGFHYYFKP